MGACFYLVSYCFCGSDGPESPGKLVEATFTANSDPITLSFNITQPERPKYVALYFSEVVKLKPGENRTFDVYLNDHDYKLKVSPSYQRCSEIRGSADPSAGPFNLKLAASQNSNMPPIISAMELYTVRDVVLNGTALEDVLGLERVTHVSDSLARWSGDPCLPVPWDWLNCSEADPPRVTSLYLGNYDLQYLQDFSQMQALETIFWSLEQSDDCGPRTICSFFCCW